MDDHEKIFEGLRPPDPYERAASDATFAQPTLHTLDTGSHYSLRTRALGWLLGAGESIVPAGLSPTETAKTMGKGAWNWLKQGPIEAYQQGKALGEAAASGDPKAQGAFALMSASAISPFMKIAPELPGMINRTSAALSSAVSNFAEAAQAGTLPTALDKLLMTQRGLLHGTDSPVDLAVTGPGKLNVRRIADEMSQALVRTTPRESTALGHSGAPSEYGHGPIVFNVKIDPEAYDQRLNLGDPKMLAQTARDIAYVADQLKGESSSELHPSYAYLTEETTTAADQVLKRYPVVDARGLSRVLDGVQEQMQKESGWGHRSNDWINSLIPAEGERQVAITRPSAITKMVGHVVNEHFEDVIPRDVTASRTPLSRDFLPFVEADVEHGMTRRLKFKMPKNIKGAFASKLQEQIQGLHDRMAVEAEKLGFQKTKANTWERPPLPETPKESIPGTSNRPRRIPGLSGSEKLKESLKQYIKEEGYQNPHLFSEEGEF